MKKKLDLFCIHVQTLKHFRFLLELHIIIWFSPVKYFVFCDITFQCHITVYLSWPRVNYWDNLTVFWWAPLKKNVLLTARLPHMFSHNLKSEKKVEKTANRNKAVSLARVVCIFVYILPRKCVAERWTHRLDCVLNLCVKGREREREREKVKEKEKVSMIFAVILVIFNFWR